MCTREQLKDNRDLLEKAVDRYVRLRLRFKPDWCEWRGNRDELWRLFIEEDDVVLGDGCFYMKSTRFPLQHLLLSSEDLQKCLQALEGGDA